MINFFRKIRKQLANDNKPLKYMRYAIGEIVLVVIGILIALQINNWNESQKLKKYEKGTLKQIQENLNRDLQSLEEIIENRKKSVLAVDKILSYPKNNPQPDSLHLWIGQLMQFDEFASISNSYYALKLKGIEIIRNEKLRKLLGEYYETEIKKIELGCNDIKMEFTQDWIPIFDKEFTEMHFKQYGVPKNTNDFLANEYYMTKIKHRRNNHYFVQLVIENGKTKAAELLDVIYEEIE